VKSRVAIVDYGMGNLRSVQKALEKVGADAQVTNAPNDLEKADAVVLPGVGAFGEAVKRLKAQGLWQPLLKTLESNKPFLGICLGYQLLFDRSEEAPGIKGLGFFKGPVVRFKKKSIKKVPHMGWNTLRTGKHKQSPFLKGVKPGDFFYFVHSYYPAPQERSVVSSTTDYGASFASAVSRDNLFACQFHPEKSGDQGQQILKNFIRQVHA
jgi:glutamine amidotransferase